MSLLGIDIGTTGCKAIVFRVDGTALGQSYREYPLLHPREGWMELDPRVVWDSVRTTIDEAVAGRTMAFDVRERCWSPELLDRAGVSAEKLPAVAPSGTVVGE